MSARLRLRPRKGAAFEAIPGEFLAKGPSSIVQAARRVGGAATLPEEIVLKRARPGFEFLLQTERVVAERIDHPNVVRYAGAARSDDRGLVLAYERLGPPPIFALNRRGVRPRFNDPGTGLYPLPPGTAIELAFDLVQALDHLHSRGFVHGRVRPSNLLVRVANPLEGGRALLESVAAGRFEGVLASLKNTRPLDWFARAHRGETGKVAPPENDPVFTPPDLFLGPGLDGSVRMAADIYAFALVFHVLLTGRPPYGATAAAALDRPEAVRALKNAEASGAVSPVEEGALDAVPLHDVAVTGSTAAWLRFRSAVEHLLRMCLDKDPARRPEAREVRSYFESELRLRWTLASGQRPWTQGIFEMPPRGNRLAPATDEGLSIREEGGEVREERRSLPPPRRRSSRSGVPGPGTPPGSRSLLELARARRDGSPLGIRGPFLLTSMTLDARELARLLVFPLGQASERLRIARSGLVERIRLGVGRDRTNEVVLLEPYVSRRHLLLECRAGRWWAKDVGSSNGVTLEGKLLRRGVFQRLEGPVAAIGLGPRSRLFYVEEAELGRLLGRALAVMGPGLEVAVREPDRACSHDAPTEKLKRPSGRRRGSRP